MLDSMAQHVRLVCAGREDRALLRSTPSARTSAGTGAGVCMHGGLSLSLACSGSQATNLGGLGAKPPVIATRSRWTYVTIFGVCWDRGSY